MVMVGWERAYLCADRHAGCGVVEDGLSEEYGRG